MAEPRRTPVELQALAAGLAVLVTGWPKDASWQAIRAECGRLAVKVAPDTSEARSLKSAALEFASAELGSAASLLARTRVELAVGAYFRARFAAALGAIERADAQKELAGND